MMAGQRTRYPWDEWFAKRRFTVTKGKHFNCHTHGMVAQIRNVASSLGKSTSIRVKDNTITVLVQEA